MFVVQEILYSVNRHSHPMHRTYDSNLYDL